jgi:hypothetical protein
VPICHGVLETKLISVTGGAGDGTHHGPDIFEHRQALGRPGTFGTDPVFLVPDRRRQLLAIQVQAQVVG